MSEKKSTVGQRIKQLRTAKEMSMRATCEAVRKLGGTLSTGHLSRIENDVPMAGTSPKLLRFLANALDGDIQELLFLRDQSLKRKPTKAIIVPNAVLEILLEEIDRSPEMTYFLLNAHNVLGIPLSPNTLRGLLDDYKRAKSASQADNIGPD